jgi:hypothetical protein
MVRLVIGEGSRSAYADTPTASSHGPAVYPLAGADPVTALVVVADDVQDAVMHSIWETWPVCPQHSRGVHAQRHEGAAVWWCASDGGHAAAQVGHWPRATG